MSVQITKEQFDALRPSNADLIQHERDGAYEYETITDHDGNEIAFASYRAGQCEGCTLTDDGFAAQHDLVAGRVLASLKGGDDLDGDLLDQMRKSVNDAVTNAYIGGIASDEWYAAACDRLGAR